MARVKVIWSDKAVSDLKQIHTYISQDSIETANQVIEKILDKTRQLELFPESGRKIPELKELSRYRELTVNPYRVQYRIEHETVFIHQIIHSKQYFEGIF